MLTSANGPDLESLQTEHQSLVPVSFASSEVTDCQLTWAWTRVATLQGTERLT
jgi:hypothetical protein